MSDSDGPSGQKATVADTWKLQVTPDAKPLISQSTKDLISKWANAYSTQYSDPDIADKYLVPVVHSVGSSSGRKYVDGQENSHSESEHLYLQYPASALGQVSCSFTNLNYACTKYFCCHSWYKLLLAIIATLPKLGYIWLVAI